MSSAAHIGLKFSYAPNCCCCTFLPATILGSITKLIKGFSKLYISDVQLEDTGQENMTLKWQDGLLSNYDYITYLNR